MLVIGHRGARSLEKENTLAAMQAGVDAGALILEFDVRLTKDGVPIVLHDRSLARTHKIRSKVAKLNYQELHDLTATKLPIPTLQEVLNEFWGTIFLNIEVKGRRTGRAATQLIAEHYIKSVTDWESCFISSFSARELWAIRKLAPHAQLGLLHNRNPFAFIAYSRQLKLSAVGFHRLYTNPLATEIAKKSDLFTYAYTVNRPKGALLLATQGIDAVVTDNPELIIKALEDNQLLS